MSTSFLRSAVAAVVLWAGGAAVAQAGCLLSVDPAQSQWIVPFDPFVSDTAERQFDVSVVNNGDAPCVGSVRVDLRGQPFGLTTGADQDRISYVLVEDRVGADVTPRSGENARRLNRRSVSLAPGDRTLLRFTFVASPEEVLASGLYAQDVFLSLEDADGVPMGERAITLGVRVASAAVMGLKGEFRRSNGVAHIDLGELRSGQKPLQASLYVLSTGSYTVSVKSENEGRLRLGQSGWYVDYALGLGEEAMNLAGGDSISVQSRRARADDYPLSVRIGDVAGKRAGAYSDVLTFTIAAL